MRTCLAILWVSVACAIPTVAARGALASDVPPYRLDPAVWQRAVVTEVMVDPEAATAEMGQWIEVSNLGSESVNLQGMVLATRTGGFHVISPAQPLILEPAEVLVLGSVAESAQNGGVSVGYAYGGGLFLAQESEVLLLLWNNALVDFATWGNGVDDRIEPGRSWSLEPPAADGTGFKQWCGGRSSYEPGVDRGTPGIRNEYCDNDGDGAAEDQGDCDDANATVAPGATELCNGVDDDCDGFTDEDVPPLPVCLVLGVCLPVVPRCAGAAGFVCDYPAGYQETETRCDGLDNDCDGLSDEDLAWKGVALGGTCSAPGICGDGTVECSPMTLAATCSTLMDGTGAKGHAERCNTLDDDCDGLTDEDFGLGLACHVGLGACSRDGHRECDPEGGTRCDADPGVPTDERCGDGTDNDCDGDVDEGFPVGETCSVGAGACRAVGKLRCAEDALSVTCMATPALPGLELCSDGVDNDCDGAVDEADCTAPAGNGGCASGSAGNGPVAWAWMLVLAALAGRFRRRAHGGPDA